MDSTSASDAGGVSRNAKITLLLHLRTDAHLKIGLQLLAGLRADRRAPALLTAFMTTDPEAGLTFHARSVRGRARAGMVTVTRDALNDRGAAVAREALDYLLQEAALQRLPRVQVTGRTPLIGVWSSDGVWTHRSEGNP